MGILFTHKNEGNPTIYNSINESRGLYTSFPCSSNSKESACDVGDTGSIPGSGRSSGEGNGNPLQYSCLENPVDRGVWWATVHGVAKSDLVTKQQLNVLQCCFSFVWFFFFFLPRGMWDLSSLTCLSLVSVIIPFFCLSSAVY